MNLQDLIIKNMNIMALLLITLLVVIVVQSFPIIQNIIAFGVIGGIATYVATKVLVVLVNDK